VKGHVRFKDEIEFDESRSKHEKRQVKAKDEGAFNQRDAQQINGREGETATLFG